VATIFENQEACRKALGESMPDLQAIRLAKAEERLRCVRIVKNFKIEQTDPEIQELLDSIVLELCGELANDEPGPRVS
jgi:hypothetical protein